MITMTNQAPAVSPDEFDEIDAILDDLRERNDETPQWEFCEGVMAALICSRRAISADEYLDVLLGVAPEILSQHGAVSAEVALAMAQGVLDHSQADYAVSVTGIAGPQGGTETKPVGLVYIGLIHHNNSNQTWRFVFEGTRQTIRQQAISKIFELLRGFINNKG